MAPERSAGEQAEIYYKSIDQVSTVDGRDAIFTRELAPFLSEGAFHRYRAIVEVEALIALSESDFPGGPQIDETVKSEIRGFYSPDLFDPRIVMQYDHIGRLKPGETEESRKKPLEHDVKAVELYLGELFDTSGHGELIEWIHFAVTSEDINNIALNLMLRDAVNKSWLPQAISIMDKLADLAQEHADTPVLGRTHLQPASPTTYGKRFATHLANIMEITNDISEVRLAAKFSGPVGNDNSMTTLAPDFNYQAFAKKFVEGFGFNYLETTGQTNNHVAIVDLFQQIKLVNTTVANISDNIRLGILLGEIVQKPREGHIGSSVMPHKVNPWRLETGEETLNSSSRQIDGLADGLIKTQLERDSGDHAWERSYGEMLGKSLAGLSYIVEDLGVISVDNIKTEVELENHYEVLAEPLQIAGRMEGDADSYMKIKEATRGQQLNLEAYQDLVLASIRDTERQAVLLNLTPTTYVGRAPEIARETAEKYRQFRTTIERGILDDSHAVDAVLFDFDNTLNFGDKDELMARLTEIALQMGLEFSPEEIIEIGSRSDWREMKQIMAGMQATKNPDLPITTEEIEAVNKVVSGTLDHYFYMQEGTIEMLEALKSSGKKLGLVTTRGSNSLPRLLEQRHKIDKYFDVIVDRDKTDRRKPHPEPIAKALEDLGIKASNRVLFVGDNQNDDIIAGMALGLRTALITTDENDRYGAIPTYRLNGLKDLQRKFGR